MIQARNIANGAVAADKIDFTTLPAQTYTTVENSVTIDEDGIYRIGWYAEFGASSSNSGSQVAFNTDLSGHTTYARTFRATDSNAITNEEFQYTSSNNDRCAFILTPGNAAGKASHGVFVSATIIRIGALLRGVAVWHASGIRSTGVSTFEVNIASASTPFELFMRRLTGSVTRAKAAVTRIPFA